MADRLGFNALVRQSLLATDRESLEKAALELMAKVTIRLSQKHRECPDILKGFFYHMGCKSPSALIGWDKEFNQDAKFFFNQLHFFPDSDLLSQNEWIVESATKGPISLLGINGHCLAATLHADQRGFHTDGSPFYGPKISIKEFLDPLPSEVRHVGIFGDTSIQDLNSVATRSELKTLSLANCGEVHDVSALENLRKLEFLDLSGLHRIKRIHSLRKLASLRSLLLDDCRFLDDIEPLSACHRLVSLSLSSCLELESLDPLQRLQNLKSLDLFQCSKINDFSAISSLCSLEKLKVSGHSGFNNYDLLAGLSELRELDISRINLWGSKPSQIDLNFLAAFEKLKILEVESWNRLQNVSSLANLFSLENLNLENCSSLVDISPLAGLPNLVSLGITGCKSLCDLSPLTKIPPLKSLCRFRIEGQADLSGCENLQNLKPLADLPWISDLQLKGCRAVSDLAPLFRLTNLESVNLAVCTSVSNLAPLGSLGKLQKLNLLGCKRIKSLSPLDSVTSLQELECDFHPAQTMGILARAAWLRRDIAMIEKCGWDWGKEAMACEKHSDSELEKLVTTLCAAFSLLGEHKLAKPTENLLDRHPEFSSSPWKAWFGGALAASGFDLYRQRVERVAIAAMPPGAIGGASATLPYERNTHWSRQWLAELEKDRLSDAKALLSVAPEICLAHARLGETEALGRWIVRFTDPSDSSALDPVQSALAGFQIANGNLPAAENHIFAIQSTKLRDPVLSKFVTALATSNPEEASARLLLIEEATLRADHAKKIASLAHASETTVHRLVVAMGDSPTNLAELITAVHSHSQSEFLNQLSEKFQNEDKTTLLKIADELETHATILRRKVKNN